MLQTTLPLAKLCAMVTMQKRGEPSVQSFSLPLTPVASDPQDIEGQAKVKSYLFGTGFFWNWIDSFGIGW